MEYYILSNTVNIGWNEPNGKIGRSMISIQVLEFRFN
jgi:hypothetical protein